MHHDGLLQLIQESRCRTFGCDDAGNDAHRAVLAVLIRGFDHQDATVLCEPSLARKSTRPPDVVLVDPVAGVHVIEVKGVGLDEVEGVDAGGQIRFRYSNGVRIRNPISQARGAMFDIKDATERAITGELLLPFKYWVIMLRISRASWLARWGANAFCPVELLFSEDLAGLADRLRTVGQKQLTNNGLSAWPAVQMGGVWAAFGDSSVLYHPPDERISRRIQDGTLGELFDDAAETYKTLSDEQQRLSSQNWGEGPRLIRGVAGSGKTIVLANNIARRLHRELKSSPTLFADQARPPRLLVICFNRSLVPFLKKKISLAFEQRTGTPLPDQGLEVFAYNRLMWHLSQKGLWRYQNLEVGDDDTRALQYLKELQHVRQHEPALFDSAGYDAIYVDEGQDFLEEDFRLLKELCRVALNEEPNLYVFYDDAQNLFGRRRPNWQSLGLNVRGGRAHVMTQCFRNTRPIVETSFNVLYGTFAEDSGDVPTKDFGDISTLEQKGLIARRDGIWKVEFALRGGVDPCLTLADHPAAEAQIVEQRLRWLIEEQKVRPQDILVLSVTRRRIQALAESLQRAHIDGVEGLHIAFDERDKILGQRGLLTLSTVASAKGYDAYCVLLASANEFTTDISGRASFYVGCTRAIEYLEVFAYRRTGLVVEMEKLLSGMPSPGLTTKSTGTNERQL